MNKHDKTRDNGGREYRNIDVLYIDHDGLIAVLRSAIICDLY